MRASIKDMRRIIYILIFMMLIPGASMAIVNGSYHDSCLYRNALVFANAMIRYVGLDSVMADYRSNVMYTMSLEVDSLGNVTKIRRLSKRFRDSDKRLRLSESEVDGFKNFLNRNNIRFVGCRNYDGHTGLSVKQTMASTKNYMKKNNDSGMVIGWPLFFRLEKYVPAKLTSYKNIVRFASSLSNERKELLDKINIQPSKRCYNSGLMMLCLSYIVGDFEMFDWIDRDPFQINMIVDGSGRPVRVLTSKNHETPIDSEIASLMEDYFKSYDVRFKIPRGSMTHSLRPKQYQIAVDIPFAPQIMDKLNDSFLTEKMRQNYDYEQIYWLNILYNLSQELMNRSEKAKQ